MKVIEKQYNDGFSGTDLKDTLEKMGAKRLLLMGINSDSCVRETADSALKFGFKIVTSKDVIASRNTNGIFWYKRNGGVLPVKKLYSA